MLAICTVWVLPINYFGFSCKPMWCITLIIKKVNGCFITLCINWNICVAYTGMVLIERNSYMAALSLHMAFIWCIAYKDSGYFITPCISWNICALCMIDKHVAYREQSICGIIIKLALYDVTLKNLGWMV